jgi:hypothetical protein
MFTSLLMPAATKEHADDFNELQRKSASPECAVRYFETANNFLYSPALFKFLVALFSQLRAVTRNTPTMRLGSR